MRGCIVEVDRGLVFPALDEGEDAVIFHALIDGIENISFLSSGLFHKFFCQLNKFVNALFLHKHLCKNLDHTWLLSFL